MVGLGPLEYTVKHRGTVRAVAVKSSTAVSCQLAGPLATNCRYSKLFSGSPLSLSLLLPSFKAAFVPPSLSISPFQLFIGGIKTCLIAHFFQRHRWLATQSSGNLDRFWLQARQNCTLSNERGQVQSQLNRETACIIHVLYNMYNILYILGT